MKKVTKKSAVIYCRTATIESDSETRIMEQEKKCQALSELDNARVIKVIKDIGKGGHHTNRPGLKEVINLARAKKVGVVYVSDVSRLSRNTSDLLVLMRLFNIRGVEVRAVQQSVSDMAETAAKGFTHHVGNLFESYQAIHRQMHSERIRKGLARKRESLGKINNK